MDDGFDDFQEATVEISAGRYAAAVSLLHSAEQKAASAKPAGPITEIKALRQQCEAQVGHGH